MDIKYSPMRSTLILLSTLLCSCVVVPKKVASYDEKCKVAVQKISLDLAPIEYDTDWSCTNDNCAWDISADIAGAVFTTATSAVVSSSVALTGNTIYWIESKGECPNGNSPEHQSPEKQLPRQQQEKANDKYLIKEEIVTAKS